MTTSHTKLVTDDHCFEIHRLMMGHAFRLAGIFERMKFTVYFAADADFVTTDTPVIRVFSSGLPLGYGLQRPDVEVRFPLSRRAFLTLTHDMKLVEKIQKADGRTRKRLLGLLMTGETQSGLGSNGPTVRRESPQRYLLCSES